MLRDRILRLERVKASTLLPNPRNRWQAFTGREAFLERTGEPFDQYVSRKVS